MKYFFRVLLVFVIAVGIIFGVYYYQHGRLLPQKGEAISLTTVSKQPATERNLTKTLLGGIENEKIFLYKTAEGVVLDFKGKEYKFENWSSDIDKETPEMYYVNVDSDKFKEIVIRAVGGTDNDTGEYVYNIYILNPNGHGFDVALATQNTWRTIIDTYVKAELTQLKINKKFLQFSMAAATTKIKYNSETGIAENGHSGYARALQDRDGNYLTIASWEKGKGIYTLKDNGEIQVEVEIKITYKETGDVQYAGKIYFELSVDDKNKLSVTQKTMQFNPEENYIVEKPKTESADPWSYTETNSASESQSGEIVWIQYTPEFDASTISETVNLSGEATDIKHIETVAIDENSVTLTAKEGYTFNPSAAGAGEFSVINSNGTDIAYGASISNEGKTLTITFDQTYSRQEIKKITIHYGAR